MALLERAAPLDEARISLARAVAGEGCVLLLSGEAGIGKTSLIAALLRELTAPNGRRLRLLQGGCEDLHSARPFGPLHEMARQLARSGEPALLELLAHDATPGVVSPAFIDLLDQAHLPSLLVFEDLHWADEATLDLLKHLGRRIARLPVLMLLSYRDDEVAADHPLARLLGDLPARHCTRLALAPLSVEAVGELCRAAGRPESGAADLHAATAGNPFFVTEVLASGVVDVAPGGTVGAVPSSIRDAVQARVVRLAPELREVLNALCVVPGGAGVDLVQALLPGAEAAVDACVARGLLVDRGTVLGFRHELARLAVADGLAPMQRRQRHAAVLQALLGPACAQATLAVLAHHAGAAGDGPRVLEVAPVAAMQAAAVGAHRQAALLFAEALRFAELASPEQRAQLHESWSYEAGLALRIDAAVIAARHRALELWRGLGRIDKVGLNLRWLSRLYWYQGDAARAERYAAEAVEVLEAHPPSTELAWAYATRAQLHMLQDRFEAARRWGELAIDLATRLDAREVLCHVLNTVGTAALFSGHTEGAAQLERSLALAQAGGFHEQAARVYSNVAEHAVVFKDFERAEAWLAEGIAFNRRHDLDAWTPYLIGWQAQLRLEQGRFDEALAIADEVLSMPRLTVIMKLPAMTVRAWTLLRLGTSEAQAALDEALAVAEPTEEGHRILPLLFARVERYWLDGDTAGALAMLQRLDSLRDLQGNPWSAGAYAAWYRRCGAAPVELPAGVAEPWALELQGRAGAAAEAWQRLGLPFEAALARLQQAREGDTPAAALAEAARLLNGLQARPALARLQALGRELGHAPPRPRGPYGAARSHPCQLTGREQQVLALLAEGLANAEIGQRLGLSPRTVEHHVSAVLAKLGAEGRSQAVAMAWRQKLV